MRRREVGRVLCGDCRVGLHDCDGVGVLALSVLALAGADLRGAGWKQGGSLWKWEREQKKGHQSCSAQKGVRA